MKKISRLMCIFFALVLMMSMATVNVYAADLAPGVESSASGDVIQSGDAATFAYNMPFATYRVYPSYLRVGGTYMTDYQAADSNFKLLNYYYDPGVTSFDNAVFYTGAIGPGKTVTTKGTAFVLTYKGAAVDIEGKSHDVRITVSDVSIHNGDAAKTSRAVSLCWGGFGIRCYMLDSATLGANATVSELASHRINNCYADVTLKMEILDTTFDGAFAFNTRDIDVEDRATGTYSGPHSERILVGSGLKSKAYITASPKNMLNVSRTADGLLFRGTQADENSFYSGFAALLDTTNVVKWSGGRCATAVYGGSYTLGIRPLYKGYNSDGTVDATYTIGTKGGDISMSESYDNSDIVYSEQAQFTQSKYTIRFYANYKPVTIKTTPEKGYKLVNFNTTTTSSSTNFSGDPITVTNNTYSFTTANENARYYNAFYEPITSSIKVHKEDQDGNPLKGVTFTAAGTSSALGAFSISGETDANGDAVIKGIPYGTSDDDYTLTETVPDGYAAQAGANPVTFHFKDTQQSFTVVNDKIYKVTYKVERDPDFGVPGDSVTPEDDNDYLKNAGVTVKPDLTTAEAAATSKDGDVLSGTWEFVHWDKEDFTITEDTTITGSWKFTPDPLGVDYVVEEDDKWGKPSDSVTPTDTNEYGYKDNVTVADDLKTTQDYAVDPNTGDKVPGTWKFTSWDKDDFTITGNTTVTGSWTFTPDTYTVEYTVGEDDKWGAPEDSVTPKDTTVYDYKDDVTVADDLKTTQDYAVDPKTGDKVPGTWEFVHWDKDDFQITENITITGTWKFIPDPLSVTYVVEEDGKWGAPEDPKAPTDTTEYGYKDNVTVADDLKTTQKYAVDPKTGDKVPGTWEFTSWDKDDFTITENTTVTGSWTFTPDTYTVEYTVKEDRKWGVPEDSVIPEDMTVYDYKDDVTVADDLKTTQKYAIDPKTGDRVPGTWEFTPWDKDDFQITENTTITGTWKFIPETYKVEYVAKKDSKWGKPSDAAAPKDTTAYDYKDGVKVAKSLTSKQAYAIDPKTGDKVPGTWEFTSWDKDDFTITEDTTITGSWIFTPDRYTVEYTVKEDSKWGKPSDSAAPEDLTVYDYKDGVKVAKNLTSKQDYAIDPKTGDKVPGTWVFTPWDKDDFIITEDTVITGEWKFIPDESPNDDEGDDKPTPPGDDDPPKTGDTSSIMLWLALMAASSIAAGIAAGKRKEGIR